jgi:hypothetical protein
MTNTRAQSGLDRLMLFLVFLVAVVALTPFLFGLGGVDLRAGTGSGGTATPTPAPTDNGVFVLGATGETGGFGEDTVGVVRVAVTKNGTGPAVDFSSVIATWIGPDGSHVLSAASGDGSESSGGDGRFAVEVTGPSASGTILNQSGDRAVLTFDLGTDDVEGIPEFGERLESGDTVTLTLTTAGGVTARTTLEVPDSLGAESTVSL